MSRSIFTNLFTAILLTIWAVPAYAQLSANFTANRTEGCAPLVVQFTDQSTGGATEWRWDLGNGTLSFLKDPAATYFNPGTYTVKLVIRNGAQSDSVVKVNYITVYASPVVNFVASDTNGCYPLPVLFNDLSTPGDGTITSWLWDFGDGDTSALPNPQHIYENAGNYNVSLQVRNSRGCIQSITRLNYIKLNTGVKADFSVGSSANCRPPTPISFINASSGTGALTYQWLFGDGGTSTQANPTHTYTTAGSYTVRLIVRNNSGCVDSMVIPNAVVIGTVDAAFTSPATVCAGQAFQLLNNSSPSPSGAIWTFGDNTSSNALNPFKTYQVPGTYQVKLVSLFGACRDSVIRNIQVLDKPTSAFTAVNTSACKPPLSVNFTQTSSNAVSYKWFFGDGDSSSAANPTHVYTSYGTFTVRLITTNAAGCTDTLRMVDFVRIQQPQVSITNIPQEGCVPYTYRPGFSIVSTDSIVRYEWHFGDGNTSDQRNPVYTYTTPGLYTVKLFYTTSGGCSDSVIATNAIRVGEKPVVNFTATPRTGCAFSPR
jgi:PKD repeat protein